MNADRTGLEDALRRVRAWTNAIGKSDRADFTVLKTCRKMVDTDLRLILARVDEAADRIETLEATLSFYEDTVNYALFGLPEQRAVLEDGGCRARAALAGRDCGEEG